jgi:hypothetical protein
VAETETVSPRTWERTRWMRVPLPAPEGPEMTMSLAIAAPRMRVGQSPSMSSSSLR